VSVGRSRINGICLGVAVVAGLHVAPARADSCARSRDYILESAADLTRRSQAYQELYKSCLQTLQLPNVKDAFILKSGAIAVLPRNDSVAATAGTLAQFCTRFPRQTLRFITRREMRIVNNVALVVQLSTSRSTPCQKISGSG
jgi:hypothetical protein